MRTVLAVPAMVLASLVSACDGGETEPGEPDARDYGPPALGTRCGSFQGCPSDLECRQVSGALICTTSACLPMEQGVGECAGQDGACMLAQGPTGAVPTCFPVCDRGDACPIGMHEVTYRDRCICLVDVSFPG